LRICFELTPLEQVLPWGAPDAATLHWFGLTDGRYRIELGEAKLFEYCPDDTPAGDKACVEYPVARLHEDLFRLAADVLDPVPDELRRYLLLDDIQAWMATAEQWERAAERSADWDAFDTACTLRGARLLDCGYLTPSPLITLWSDDEMVHVEWNNTLARREGHPTWTALAGRHSVTHSQFVDALITFHTQFMAAMGVRVDAVLEGALPEHIAIDVESLRRDHQSRRVLPDLRPRTGQKHWNAIRRAIKTLESSASVSP
jgi:hypothetical protein